jgi:hypothetical protein
MSDQGHPQDFLAERSHFFNAPREFNTASFAASSCVDLSFYYPKVSSEFLGGGHCFVWSNRDLATRLGHDIGAEDLFGLVFMNIHRVLSPYQV